jgi:predicted enzyme related to lactoylglutathione lyase
MTTNRHLIITPDEQNTIVNALAFYKAYFTFTLDADDAEQYRYAFREDGETAVDKLTTKVAIIK